MRFLLISIIMLLSKFAIAQMLPDSLVKKHNIYKITCVINSRIQASIFTEYYNKQGLLTKSIIKNKKSDYLDSDSSITFFYYSDTICIKETGREFLKKKLVNSFTTTYTYKNDHLGRRISKLTTENTGSIKEETYSWNKNNLIDTICYYSNDTMFYSKTRGMSSLSYGKIVKLYRTIINEWDTNGAISKTVDFKIAASSVNNSTPYRVVQYYKNGDTSIQKITYRYNNFENIAKELIISENEKFMENERGDKAMVFSKRDSRGLLTESRRTEQQTEAGEIKSVASYHYFFRQSK